MRRWTPEIDAEAAELYQSWTEAHIRRDQDLVSQQIRMAYDQGNTDAMLDLQAHHDALSRELLRRCYAL